jgi:hypothetical protein
MYNTHRNIIMFNDIVVVSFNDTVPHNLQYITWSKQILKWLGYLNFTFFNAAKWKRTKCVYKKIFYGRIFFRVLFCYIVTYNFTAATRLGMRRE